jgi:dTDP-glucose 4,6-dehydratase
LKLLITGGAGFIGSSVVRLAVAKGYSVVNVDALKYSGRIENLGKLIQHKRHIFEKADVCKQQEIEKLLLKYKPDAIMHLAAETHVDRSIDQPYDFVKSNIIGTFSMLQATRSYLNTSDKPNFKFHHVSTDEVYGSLSPSSTKKFLETSPYKPRSPYSASKASSDHLVRAWGQTYQLPFLLTNCSNNYGPYQFPEKLIPLSIMRALSEQPLQIYGEGTNVRDWLFVDDHAEALLTVIESGKTGRQYNIGGDNEKTNLEVVKQICRLMDDLKPRKSGSYLDLIAFTKDRPGHDFRYALDISRIKSELSWRPSTNFEDGLKKTIKWYLENEIWWRPLLNELNLNSHFG